MSESRLPSTCSRIFAIAAFDCCLRERRNTVEKCERRREAWWREVKRKRRRTCKKCEGKPGVYVGGGGRRVAWLQKKWTPEWNEPTREFSGFFRVFQIFFVNCSRNFP